MPADKDEKIELTGLTVRMTQAMFDDSRDLVFQDRIPHAEWVRRCMTYGIKNPDVITKTRCPDEYKVRPRGAPRAEY